MIEDSYIWNCIYLHIYAHALLYCNITYITPTRTEWAWQICIFVSFFPLIVRWSLPVSIPIRYTLYNTFHLCFYAFRQPHNNIITKTIATIIKIEGRKKRRKNYYFPHNFFSKRTRTRRIWYTCWCEVSFSRNQYIVKLSKFSCMSVFHVL